MNHDHIDSLTHMDGFIWGTERLLTTKNEIGLPEQIEIFGSGVRTFVE